MYLAGAGRRGLPVQSDDRFAVRLCPDDHFGDDKPLASECRYFLLPAANGPSFRLQCVTSGS